VIFMGMLVLTRHVDESIVIGGNVTVTVLQVRGDAVRIGVSAPLETTIHRHEIQDKIDRDGGHVRTPEHHHRETVRALRDALHVVRARAERDGDGSGGVTARLTRTEWEAVEGALATPGGGPGGGAAGNGQAGTPGSPP
jgi:carbon storage regulator